MRKLVTLLLAAMMLFGLCSMAHAEPIEITFAPYMFGPLDPSRDIITPKIEEILREKYGIDVKLTNVYVEYPNYKEIINTRIAGGTAPDIWLGQNESGIREYYNQGVIASWTREFFEENAPNVAAFINNGGSRNAFDQNAIDRWWKGSTIATDDGKMVTLPSPLGDKPYGQKGVVYRGDWIDKLGVDKDNLPYEIDDFVALMRRFVNEDPDGNGKNDTFGFSTSMIKAFFTAYGVYSSFGPSISGSSFNSQWYVQDDGIVRNADTLPGAKAALEICAKLYAEGLIDPEFITGENTGGYWAISQGFINGIYGVSAHASYDHFRFKEVLNDDGGPVAKEYWAVNGPDSKFYYGPWIAGPDGAHGYYLDNDYGLGESYVYNIALEKNPEKLAAILKILDAFAVDEELMLLAAYGIEGETFEWTEFGSPRFLLANDEMNAVGVMATRSIYGPNNTYNAQQTEYSFYNNPTVAARLNWQAKPYYDTYIRPDIVGTPKSTSTYQADLMAFRDETFISIIKGELPIEYFDTFVTEYLARGGQVLQDEATQMYIDQNK